MKTLHRLPVAFLLVLLLGIFSCEDPNGPGSEFTVTVTGRAITSGTGAGIDSVLVTVDVPFKRDTAGTDGSYSFTFTSKEDNEITANIRLSHMNLGYFDTTIAAVYSRTKTKIAMGDVRLRGVTSSRDSTQPTRPSFRPKVVTFIRSTYPLISIKGAGNDITSLTFEVRDSIGNPVDQYNKATVRFAVVTAPDAGVALNRSSTVTNALGQVVVQLSAGTRAGIAQVQASYIDTTKVPNDTIKSPVVSVTIAGGAPVLSRFALGVEKYNVPGLAKYNVRNTVTAMVADTFGNPVQKGTVVYFTTTAGTIPPYAATNDVGQVSVDLISGPGQVASGIVVVTATVGTPGTPNTGSVNGAAMDEAVIIKGLKGKRTAATATSKRFAKTADAAGTTLVKSVNVLFTGAPIVSSTDSTFVVPLLGSKNIQFTVRDLNNNPMSQGTNIKVTGIGMDTVGADLSGDLAYTMIDTYDPSFTRFNVTVKDRRTRNLNLNIPIGITVEVTGENGNIKKTFTGFLTSAVADSGKVGSITILNNTVDSLVAVGAGSPNSTLIQARVLTAGGVPSNDVPVNFSIVRSVNGGEYLSNTSARTNSSGVASVTLFSGIRSGLVQVQAAVRKDSLSLSSDVKSIYIKTGTVTSLTLVSTSANILSVKGGGGTETAVLIFEAKDSLGNTVDGSNITNVAMSIQGDTAGARINPTVTKTDPNTGRVTALLTAGSQSGIILVTAQSGSVKSSTVQISVAGGLPSQLQFTLTIPKKNYSVITDRTATVSVLSGDAYGNPARSGSVINFKSNGGLIEATSSTNSSGSATATLQIANPMPPGGIATVEAKTYGANGVLVRDTQTVVFSREAVITEIGGPFDQFEIEDGLSKTFQYRVADVNGNPLAAGNTITVEATSDTGIAAIVATGDIAVTTQDNKLTGTGRTVFSFTLTDPVKNDGKGPKKVGVKISVNGPNTVSTISHAFDGTLKGGTGQGNEGSVAFVNFVSATRDTIFVANAGTPTTDTITFRVVKLNQVPVKNAAVQFSYIQSLNSSEMLSPSYAVSDDSGYVKVTAHSGIRSGVLKVQATVTAGASSITSQAVPVYVKTGPLHSIAFISSDRNELAVKGVGGDENANLVFEARDLLGNPLDFANQSKLYFGFIGVAGNDEEVNPDSAVTNPFTGRASVNVVSGTRSTVLQVFARNASGTIKSSPVPLVVHGGFPVDSLFSFTTNVKNISSKEKNPVQVKMSLGDRYGNPVKPGTAVYFESSVGIIKASAFTDEVGVVATTVTPSENLGLRKIIASTVGESGGSVNVLLKKQMNVLMSGVPVITVPKDTVVLYDGGETTVQYKIADASNNPISSGHVVSAAISGNISSELQMSGDNSFITLDVNDTASTNFQLTLRDLLPLAGSGGVVTVTVVVDGVTGKTQSSFYVKLYSPNNISVPPSVRQPAQIAFISATATDLSVAGVGALENALLTYEVRDSLGVAIDKSKRTVATYSLQFFPNTFVGGGTSPKVIPTIDSTDDQGKLRLSIVSGTQAGNVQVIVKIQVGSNTITSQPVKLTIHGGFPDQNHFTLRASRRSFLGYGLSNQIGVTVTAADTFGNPVNTGTAILFYSQAGVMQTGQSTFGAYTNSSGQASVNFLTENPIPSAAPWAYLPSSGTYQSLINNRPGYHWIYAQTQGHNGVKVIDSVLVLQCIGPITPTGIPSTTVSVTSGGSSAAIPITIKDANGNPLPEGTTITVSVANPTSGTFSVSGDISNTGTTTIASGSIFPGSGVTDFSFKVYDMTVGGASSNTSCTITINVSTPSTTAGVTTSYSRSMSFVAKVP